MDKIAEEFDWILITPNPYKSYWFDVNKTLKSDEMQYSKGTPTKSGTLVHRYQNGLTREIIEEHYRVVVHFQNEDQSFFDLYKGVKKV